LKRQKNYRLALYRSRVTLVGYAFVIPTITFILAK